MITKILIPTDGSKTAMRAVDYAIELAGQIQAEITLLSVIDRLFYAAQIIPAAGAPTHIIEPIEDYMKQATQAILDETEKHCREKGVQVNKVIANGHPVEEIIKEAVKLKSDLIVMGSHGKSAMQAMLLGSVTFGVIHKDSKIPVLVVRR